MVAMKPKVVIIGAGMAGLVAAHKLYKANTHNNQLFELCIVEGGTRIGGRIQTTEFCGNKVEMGATWIHGIGGNPIYEIAKEIDSLESNQPWERMDGFLDDDEYPLTVLENGLVLDSSSIVEPISSLYKNLMAFAQGKLLIEENNDYVGIANEAFKICISSDCKQGKGKITSVGSFLRRGLETYWIEKKEENNTNRIKSVEEEAVFGVYENTERTYTSAGDLFNLDFNAELEYKEFPDEEITIPKGYSSIMESLASVLPDGLIQFGKKVVKIEWKSEAVQVQVENIDGTKPKPVKLHFEDGSVMEADHVIVTVSLGVLKAGIQENSSGMFEFDPPLPSFKTQAISRLGFGVVNKLFLQLDHQQDDDDPSFFESFPFLQMAYHQEPADSELRHHRKIPWWMRRTASLFPIFKNSSVVLSWFAGDEALEVESLKDEEIINGVTTTISNFLKLPMEEEEESDDSAKRSNGFANSVEKKRAKNGFKFTTSVLKSGWGTNPLFMGSYSYVAVGSSGDDIDTMAKPLPLPLPCLTNNDDYFGPLQILFAGEATHRTHYSTTHGAYFSGVREANRLLKHYNCDGFSGLLHH